MQYNGLPVKGYQSQSDVAVSLVNENKTLEERILRQIDSLGRDPSIDQRWLAIGRTAIEQAFMAMNRAIFQPQRFDLMEDDPLLPIDD